ncbi:hypothetical protein TRIHO_33480 [Tritonibacter horizontis]|uniref:Uncharacterized protein n=2 Tax=Tritonibacter horizontis TaxID=1768241 RepID=A0A132BVG4_9RHOB|nr:hypothetical protein TRIHO_33480 [Tritonibacter horizontis]
MMLPEDIENALITAEREVALIAAVTSNELRGQSDELGAKLSDLHNSGAICLTSESNLNAIQALDHKDFWIAVHPLKEAIPNLLGSHGQMLAYVNTLVKKAGSDGAAGMPNVALIEWCRKNPEEASKIVERAQNCDPLGLEHGLFAVLALANPKSPFELIRHAELKVRTLGLRSLGRMEDLSLEHIKAGVDEALRALKVETDEDVRTAAIEASFRLWENAPPKFRYKQTDLINSIGELGNQTELTVLAAMLFYHNKGLVGADIDLVLDWLSKKPSNAAATLRHLDMAIRRNDERWKFENVVSVIEFCLPMLDKPVDADGFYGFRKWLWDDPKHASYLFSRWLLNGQRQLCDFLSEILQALSAEQLINIQKGDLPTKTADQVFLAQKCIGYLWNHETVVASILLSIVRNGTTDARANAEELLFHPMLLSYGGNLRSYLEGQRGNNSKRISESIERLLSKHDMHISGTEEVRDVVELCPTIEQRRAVAMKDRDRNRDIQKAAHKRSIFADLATHQTLLYGRKSLSIIHGVDGEQHPQITELTEHSYSVELPRLSVIDPVGFNQLLTVFRARTRAQS